MALTDTEKSLLNVAELNNSYSLTSKILDEKFRRDFPSAAVGTIINSIVTGAAKTIYKNAGELEEIYRRNDKVVG